MEGGSAQFIYDTQWPTFGLAWSPNSESPRLAISSLIEQNTNHLQILEMNEETKRLESVAEVQDAFPPTKLMWKPRDGSGSDGAGKLLASSSTTLNLWKVEDGTVKRIAKLANTRSQKQPAQNAPLTSFDWSSLSPHKIGASSVDTTCTIWNVEKQKIETQLIAHDKAVYDIAFSQVDSDNLFASVGADGSMRLFDQRNLDHSTIIYEANPPRPLLRLAWNMKNKNHIATVAMDSPGVNLIDIRRPAMAVAALSTRDSCVNSITWAPHSSKHLLCGTDDGYGIIFDTASAEALSKRPQEVDPAALVAHDCDEEVLQTAWPSSSPDYVALGTTNRVRVLKV
mmetsp:Transcript_103481/g.183824  ORF Transcript_103481/g.183824 Transcript_103481/m.183824 type:complete len:340 (-) Transcript_103481:152-1171(-)|eukprot:CAMPEP_0197658626 /NCGR_PEP_ID=MMETSP1338-20131121/45345_1 /TAXON_ID=43686 ORGANISM="Pelagodinium beii, Strain RCC1491" /NCGR_SAMPLE_ID=MMETSP1338 /ASSEMBLY_ACC=CAM_ASM_000754 /LENGTH=339 /DNA_ID=CAMNT_0043235243 /DNA_START=77 /DNA_END=1096 /DNA_ORIENTATION=+